MRETDLYYEKMTKTPLARLIISLGIPTTISMLITNIYNMVDTYFVGTLGESQQAATGILFTLQAIIQAIAFMLGQGSGSLVSKALADKNTEERTDGIRVDLSGAVYPVSGEYGDHFALCKAVWCMRAHHVPCCSVFFCPEQ